MRRKIDKTRIVLTLIFSLCVFFILTITMFLSGAILIFLIREGIIQFSFGKTSSHILLLSMFGFASILIGTFVSVGVGHIPIKPMRVLIEGMNKLAAGKYETRIDLSKLPIGKEITESFNTLASELENTEMLRSDFVNNFSHEFKTPIVSISGFAKLLAKGKLSKEKELEYIRIIEEESRRLADMTTKVLELTKVENQNILTEQTEYNLSEQIRNSILLLEKKWSVKELSMDLVFGEYTVYANEELLKQVWINLLDNAIKFSSQGGEITVDVRKQKENIQVSIKNQGEKISEENKKFIFKKFYQTDRSHAREGNGIGLAIVKKIVELHKGEIFVDSNDEETVFCVQLPCQSIK